MIAQPTKHQLEQYAIRHAVIQQQIDLLEYTIAVHPSVVRGEAIERLEQLCAERESLVLAGWSAMPISAEVQITKVVDQIREWELDNGEGFTDYFLDRYSYGSAWLTFLSFKGFHELVEEIKADVWIAKDGTVFECTDQNLKFEPYSFAQENDGGPWDEDIYRKDVALWAEFIISHVDILEDYEAFISGAEVV